MPRIKRLAAIADGRQDRRIALASAAAGVLALRADDAKRVAAAKLSPHTTPGAYVPTVLPAALQWPQPQTVGDDTVDNFDPVHRPT